jgi:hypothetical protein
MPSIQKRIVSTAEEISKLQARVLQLETRAPSGMTLLDSYVSASGATNPATAPETEIYYQTPGFTLHRPVPIFLLGTMTVGPDAAATGNVYVRASIYNQLGGNRVLTGTWCGIVTTISAGTLQAFVPAVSTAVGVVAAGSYYADFSYESTPGAMTFAQYALYVFQIAG